VTGLVQISRPRLRRQGDTSPARCDSGGDKPISKAGRIDCRGRCIREHGESTPEDFSVGSWTRNGEVHAPVTRTRPPHRCNSSADTHHGSHRPRRSYAANSRHRLTRGPYRLRGAKVASGTTHRCPRHRGQTPMLAKNRAGPTSITLDVVAEISRSPEQLRRADRPDSWNSRAPVVGNGDNWTKRCCATCGVTCCSRGTTEERR